LNRGPIFPPTAPPLFGLAAPTSLSSGVVFFPPFLSPEPLSFFYPGLVTTNVFSQLFPPFEPTPSAVHPLFFLPLLFFGASPMPSFMVWRTIVWYFLFLLCVRRLLPFPLPPHFLCGREPFCNPPPTQLFLFFTL